ncbi:hypothetical protein AGR7C_Cc100102 [Agrobacterium deltaense Zutra 3/1]|uniref:Uncharacterized protein n=1 Tax=Agrobacterium deltaense Zutra 3/1 TaxID=1183427 RepID=A0A1S7NWP2_9HYPH|nr:hypothetical protein AGR7C_Cc100102 [Agrobacterium deltaense Zutra 3/1]
MAQCRSDGKGKSGSHFSTRCSRAFPGKVEPGFPSGNAPKQGVRVFSRFEEKRKNSKPEF